MREYDKYLGFENTLQLINRDYVSLSKVEMAENNEILGQLLEEIIQVCRDSCSLFDELYEGLFYGGSFFDGLKIRRPDEYDICIKLRIKTSNIRVIPSDIHKFVRLQFSRIENKDPKLWNRWLNYQRPYYGTDDIHMLVNEDGFLDTKKVMQWMHRILSTWLKGEKIRRGRVSWKKMLGRLLTIKLRRHGPAFTFRITDTDDLDIAFDLVPSFVFGEDQWPAGFRRNMVRDRPDFSIVMKSPKYMDEETTCCRLSFQEQEKEIINNKERLKPGIRLIKKLREKLLLEKIIPSYYIKNLFLWEAYNRRNETFWRLPLSYVFIRMVKKFQICLENRQIPYFWHGDYNLLEDIDEEEKEILQEKSEKLKFIINNIENNLDDDFMIATYLLSRKEMKIFRSDYVE